MMRGRKNMFLESQLPSLVPDLSHAFHPRHIFALLPSRILSLRNLIVDGGCRGGSGGRGSGRGGDRRCLELGIVPWASIRQLASALAVAASSENLGEVLGRDLTEELGLVLAAKNVDLLNLYSGAVSM